MCKYGILKFSALFALTFFILTFQVNGEIPEYSCTWINEFDTASDLPDCDDDTDQTIAWLGSRGYDRRFVWSDQWVWDIDFDIYNSGYEGLDEADFHIHCASYDSVFIHRPHCRIDKWKFVRALYIKVVVIVDRLRKNLINCILHA